MRIVTYSAAVTLDGFIAGPHGEIDWIHSSDDTNDVLKALWEGVDAILWGRKTWEFAAAQGGGSGGSSRIKSYVFSRTLPSVKGRGVTLVRDDAGGFVRRLKSESGGRIFLMGGGELARSLIDAGLVDEVLLDVHPLLLGDGVPLFAAGNRRIQLELTESRAIHGGSVVMNYRVVNR